jgi:para-nitrobenzyl esterase
MTYRLAILTLLAAASVVATASATDASVTDGTVQPAADRPVTGGATTAATDRPITGGTIHGLTMPDGSLAYYAVPFAAPPVGDLRWKPAQPVVPWNGTRDATQPPPPCFQHDEGWNKTDAATGKEDCLYLSIRSPKHRAKERLPVFFWIHGGSNRAGDGFGYIKDSTITQRGVILVAVEYRLGPFGFLGLPELTAESPQHASGNYGLTDLIAALQWVRTNIATFGGDPSNVTIAGQSAGSMDVVELITSPLAKGLFKQAISESGVPGASRTAAQNETVGNALFGLMHIPSGPDGLKALRAAPAQDVLVAGDNLKTPPGIDDSLLWGQQIVDGWVEPLSTREVFAAHKQAPVPMIIGNNTREFPVDLPPDQQRNFIRQHYGARADDLLKLYGLEGSGTGNNDPVLGASSVQLITDLVFRCPSNWLAKQMSGANLKVWRYQFGLPDPTTPGPVAHSAELKYVFNQPPPNATFGTWPPVQQYWANFARTGNPNGPGLPRWPDMGKKLSYMAFTPSGPEVGENLRGPICDIIGGER